MSIFHFGCYHLNIPISSTRTDNCKQSFIINLRAVINNRKVSDAYLNFFQVLSFVCSREEKGPCVLNMDITESLFYLREEFLMSYSRRNNVAFYLMPV